MALPLFLSVVLYAASPGLMRWASFEVPESLKWVRWVGAALALSCIPLARWVFAHLGSNVSETVLTKQHHELVTTGPYRWVRHPLYSTGLMLFAGVGLMNLSWFVLLFAALTLAGVLFIIIPREETQLSAVFGDDYRRLTGRTGRLFPRLFPPA